MKINFSIKRLANSLMWRFFAAADMRFTLRSGIVVQVADKNEMATFSELFIHQDYDHFLDHLPMPTSVLDLGCNSGYFDILIHHRARLCDTLAPKLVFVNANAQAVRRARVVIGNLKVAEYVIGLIGSKGSSQASFYLAPASAESSAVKCVKHAREIKVARVELAALIREHFTSGLDLIKCDIEGGEESLVREWGGELKQSKTLLIEWHGFEGTREAFCSEFTNLGFKCTMELPTSRFKNALFLQAKSHH